MCGATAAESGFVHAYLSDLAKFERQGSGASSGINKATTTLLQSGDHVYSRARRSQINGDDEASSVLSGTGSLEWVLKWSIIPISSRLLWLRAMSKENTSAHMIQPTLWQCVTVDSVGHRPDVIHEARYGIMGDYCSSFLPG